MANNFTAEDVNSAGQIFATRQIDASSIHYPLGLIAWGASAAEVVTSTSAPLPVQLFGNGLSSAAPVFAGNNSAHPLFVRGMTSSAVTVTGTISLSGNNSVVTSSAAPLHVRGLTDSHVAVTGDSASPLFVRGLGDSTVPVSGTVTATISTASKIQTELIGNASVVTSSGAALHVRGLTDSHVAVTGDSGNPMFVRGLTSSGVNVINDTATPIVVRGATDSTVPVSGTLTINALSTATKIQTEPVTSSANRTFVDNNSGHPLFVRGLTSSAVDVTGTVTVGAVTAGAGVGLNALSSATGALLAQTLTLSSLAQTVLASPGRLYGYSVSSPDTADNAWFLIYPEDSAGVTLGTSSALINQMVPFGGGREASWPQGVLMSSGMSIAAAATAGSTVHDTPGATLTMTVYYAASS